jgi:uncharacterized protein YtpQ (UPF0354 family)
VAETAVVIALIATALAISAVAVSYRRFADLRSRLAAHIQASAPEMTVESPTDTGLRLRVLGAEVDLDLASLARRRPREQAERAWFDRIIQEVRATVPAPQVPPLALVRDQIVPLLKPAAYVEVFERYPPGRRLVWRALSEDVRITYALTGIHQFTAVTDTALAAWSLTSDALHALALENLRAQTRHLLDEIGGPRRRYEHLDGMDATRLLVADLIVPEGIVEPLLAIPEETVLLVAPVAERAHLAAESAELHGTTIRPLTPVLFRPTPDGAAAAENSHPYPYS